MALPLFFPISRIAAARIDPQAARPLHELLAMAGLPCRASGRCTERQVTVVAGRSLDIEKEPGDWGGVRITVPAGMPVRDAARLAVGAMAYALMDLVARESIRGQAWARPALAQEFGPETICRNKEPGKPAHHPAAPDRGSALLQALEGFDDAFAAALDTERLAQQPPQERDALY